MALDSFLLQILVCPDTKQPVKLAAQELVEKLNRKIESGAIKNVAGAQVVEKVDAALVREDGALVYPVREDIPVMLAEEGIRAEQI